MIGLRKIIKGECMKKALITGVTGQTASYLAEYILENHKNYEVHCTRRWRSREDNITNFRNKVMWHSCEMKDQFNVYNIIKKTMPDKIFVYSASSFVRDSWIQPQEYFNENISHLLNVMNSILMINNVNIDTLNVKLKYNPKIFIALSSEEYGHVDHGVKITEDTILRPISPYGVSKVSMELLGYQYWKSYGLNVLLVRTFNHESPRRGHIFVTGSFCKQVALIESKIIKPVLYVGNVNSVRDWLDARDCVQAAWVATEKCEPGEPYNVCSEKAYTIQEFISKLQELSKVKFEVKVDPNKLRPSDVTWLLGDCTKFKKKTGWKPQHDFMLDTVPDMLNYWRKKIAAEKYEPIGE